MVNDWWFTLQLGHNHFPLCVNVSDWMRPRDRERKRVVNLANHPLLLKVVSTFSFTHLVTFCGVFVLSLCATIHFYIPIYSLFLSHFSLFLHNSCKILSTISLFEIWVCYILLNSFISFSLACFLFPICDISLLLLVLSGSVDYKKVNFFLK
jgi:hypothetical protein